jgi:hypothetical protein
VLDSRFAIPRRAFETGRRSRLDSEEVATTIGRGPDRAGIVTVLREHIGIEPSDPAMVLKLAAIGITNGTWRNSPLEDWHAEGRIHDGGMLRTNVATTKLVRDVLTDQFGAIIGREGVPFIATEDLVTWRRTSATSCSCASLSGCRIPLGSCLMGVACANSQARISTTWSSTWTVRWADRRRRRSARA